MKYLVLPVLIAAVTISFLAAGSEEKACPFIANGRQAVKPAGHFPAPNDKPVQLQPKPNGHFPAPNDRPTPYKPEGHFPAPNDRPVPTQP